MSELALEHAAPARRTKPTDWIWRPQPGPQFALVMCPREEVFFGGARGGGKTDGVLGKWSLKEKRYGKHFNAVMFRRTTVSAEDAIERSKEIYGPLGGAFNETKLRWRMPHGGRVTFSYLESIKDANEYQGRNLTDAWVEEAGQYPDPGPIDRLFGVLRSAHGVPVQLVITANPGGAGQHWLRDRYRLSPFPLGPKFIDRRLPNGSIHKIAVIPSRISDNKYLGADYVDRLHLVGSDQLIRAWLEGDWSAIEGAFFDCWSEAKHVITPFAIPDDWLRFRSGDWGSASPASIGWWAVVQDDFRISAHSTGMVARHDRTPSRGGDGTLPRGAIIRYREDYIASGPGRGLKLTAEQVAERIIERERGEKLAYGVLDPSAFKEDGGPSIAERINTLLIKARMAPFRAADNSRVARTQGRDRGGPMGGWDQMRARMIGNPPMICCFSTCKDSIRTIPVLQHDPNRAEDLDTTSEDHCFAAGTMVETYNGRVPIEHIKESGSVISLGGKYEAYRSARMTRRDAEIVCVTFADGRTVRCTKDHKFLVYLDEWRYAKDLQGLEVSCVRLSCLRQFRNSTAHDIICAENTFSAKVFDFTLKSGNIITALFRTAGTFITSTKTTLTMSPAISNALLFSIISGIAMAKPAPCGDEKALRKPTPQHGHGMDRRQGERGTQTISRRTSFRQWRSVSPRFVQNAVTIISLARLAWHKASFAAMRAKRVHCVSVEDAGRADVYCLTVPTTGCFAIEGGIIVSNCADDWRYACMSRPWLKSPPEKEEPRDAYVPPHEDLPNDSFKLL